MKKESLCYLYLYDRLYGENIYIFVGKQERMNEEFPEVAPFHVGGGKTFPFPNKDWPGICIWISNEEYLDILAHEAVHAGNHILRMKGVKIDRVNDEALAYYVQWIMTEYMEAE